MESGESSFLQDYLPYLLRRADQTLSEPFYALLNKYEVARSEWRVLAVLQETGELTVAELAQIALSPQPTVTHALRRLEERGLIVRKLGTSDKRKRFVSITKSGSKLTNTLMAEAKRLEAEALTESGDLTTLISALRGLTDTVEASKLVNDHLTSKDQR